MIFILYKIFRGWKKWEKTTYLILWGKINLGKEKKKKEKKRKKKTKNING